MNLDDAKNKVERVMIILFAVVCILSGTQAALFGTDRIEKVCTRVFACGNIERNREQKVYRWNLYPLTEVDWMEGGCFL